MLEALPFVDFPVFLSRRSVMLKEFLMAGSCSNDRLSYGNC